MPAMAAPDETTKHFLKIAEGIDLMPIRAELAANPEAWLADTSRQTKVRCQRETETIYLRSAVKPFPPGIDNGNDVHESRATRMSQRFPDTLAWCEAFARSTGGRLGRVVLVSLRPKGRVYPHVDHGAYYAVRDRFHLVVDSPSGSPLITEDETAVLQEGELWVFDNKKRHEATNQSDMSRIHLIFDVEPKPGRGHYVASSSTMA